MSPQKRLRKNAARREANRQVAYVQRVVSKPPSDRSIAKESAWKSALDQVELDKLEGLESGRIARRALKERMARIDQRRASGSAPTKKRRRHKIWGLEPRPADSYRGRRYNLQDKRDRVSRLAKKLLRASGKMRQMLEPFTVPTKQEEAA